MVQKRLSEAAKKRLHAGRKLQEGKGCAEVALAVGVARQTVYTMKAASTPCAPCPSRADQRALTRHSWPACARSCKVLGSAPNCGRSSAWARSSNACTACVLAGARLALAWLALVRQGLLTTDRAS